MPKVSATRSLFHKPMAAQEFRAALIRMNIARAAFANILCVGENTVRRWAAGDDGIPLAVAVLVRLMLNHQLTPDEVIAIRDATQPTRCNICHCKLDQPGDDLSRDCGGDCWGCVSKFECPPGVELEDYRANQAKYVAQAAANAVIPGPSDEDPWRGSAEGPQKPQK